ncbi:MAG: APC family permease [Gammaproteobacteria bacterium]|jgi:amino acid transporter
MGKSNSNIGIFTIAMMSVAGIFTLRTLPLMAVYGLSSAFYYVIAALLFFVPSALVCAELATGWSKTGGLYVWVREAFGRRLGFLAIWLEWTNTVISFPATLAFITATIAYAINPALANNKTYMLTLMLTLFWGTTFINFLGIKFSSWVSNIGLIIGTGLPCLLIIVLAIDWLITGHHSQISFTAKNILPNFSVTRAAFLVGLILGYSGMQISAFHAQEVNNPQRNFPRAILIAVLIILLLSITGSLAIAMVVPSQKISLVTGLMQATVAFFNMYHLSWMVPIIAILTALGAFSMLNIWIIGPCKGLLATANHGDLPQPLQYINKHNAPTLLLLLQALIGTMFSLVYLLMPTINSSYWILIALTSILTLMMCILIFASVIRLRYTQPEVYRAYRIPGGNFGAWITGGIGIITCAFAFFLGFMPPEQLHHISAKFYESFLIGGVVILTAIPFIKKFKHQSA